MQNDPRKRTGDALDRQRPPHHSHQGAVQSQPVTIFSGLRDIVINTTAIVLNRDQYAIMPIRNNR